jgi:DNA (cytosine-5)-methyltransferase 1
LGFDRLETGWKTVWFSQWEPGAKTQWAHDCYVKHFGDSVDMRGEYHTGKDISEMDKDMIPNHTLLVGGFPCQDYSVAHSLSSSQGIEGKKGVLWWQIRDTLIAKKAPFCILENVDRLLKSPAKQRGRDFGVILACLSELGYSVEWRVVNAAQYGAAQRRRRTFIFAYKNDTIYGKKMTNISAEEIIKNKGFMASAFPVNDISCITETTIQEDIVEVSNNFKFAFENAGYMHEGKIYTSKISELEEEAIVLEKILQRNADEKYYITSDVEISNKKDFLKMKKEYYKITSIGDYSTLQDKLYENKTKPEILSFELSRLLRKNYDDPEMLEYIASIQSILSSYKGDINDNLYMDIVDIIISLELSLGMRIGLFRELCMIFEKKLHDVAMKITTENNNRTR